jgi:RHS repeat-associated protein
MQNVGEIDNPLTALEATSAVDLNYYRARYYDPEGGRFRREDPMRFSAGVNFYDLTNSLVSRSDPLGLCPNSCPPSGNAPSPRQYQAMGYKACDPPYII